MFAYFAVSAIGLFGPFAVGYFCSVVAIFCFCMLIGFYYFLLLVHYVPKVGKFSRAPRRWGGGERRRRSKILKMVVQMASSDLKYALKP